MKNNRKNPRLKRPDRDELHRLYTEMGLSQSAIAQQLGGCAARIGWLLKKYQIPTRFSPTQRKAHFSPFQGKAGKDHPRWNGGVNIDKGGYRLVKAPDHPHANPNGYVREHRLVMEQKLGRPLRRDEVVHHLDRNRQNNHPDNLSLFRSNAEHMAETMVGHSRFWSKERYERTLQVALSASKKAAAIQEALRAYAQEHSVSLKYLRTELPPAALVLLRTELAQGRFECPPSSLIERASAGQLVPTAQS